MSRAKQEFLRFEIIKRLAPGFRHRISGKLHPVTLLSQVLSKKIEMTPTDTDFFLTKFGEIKEFTKQANDTCLELFSWLIPSDTLQLPLKGIVNDCLDLLKMDIHSSNVTFQNDITSDEDIPANSVRDILCACILTLIDTTKNATQVVISRRTINSKNGIVMSLYQTDGKSDKEVTRESIFNNWEKLGDLNETVKCVPSSNQVLILLGR